MIYSPTYHGGICKAVVLESDSMTSNFVLTALAQRFHGRDSEEVVRELAAAPEQLFALQEQVKHLTRKLAERSDCISRAEATAALAERDGIIDSLGERCHRQSELLSRRAESQGPDSGSME